MRPLLLLLLIACASQSRNVFVPASSRDCWESCNEKAKACEPGDMPNAEAYVDTAAVAAAQRERDGCAAKRRECLLACPGAHEE